jgi:hypothetical protein
MTLWLLSVIIVASMICSYIVIIRPPQEPAAPTSTPPMTQVPRATDTPLPQTPTPSVTPSPQP